jgi:hypothetical protein
MGQQAARLSREKRERALVRCLHDRRRQRMFTVVFEARGDPKKFVVRDAADGPGRHEFRLALCQRARLVDHARVDLFEALQRLGVLDQDARSRQRERRDRPRRLHRHEYNRRGRRRSLCFRCQSNSVQPERLPNAGAMVRHRSAR